MLTFAAEYKIFGLNSFIFHLSNLLLHLLCTLLVFQILRLLKLNPLYAAIGAIIFGVHPMHVESVAWIAERKELLYSLFFLTSIIVYINYLNSQKNKLILFLLSLFLFILALFSKITAVTLPLSLLLFDYYLERPFKSKVFIEKIPFFIFSLIFGIAEIIIFQRQGILKATEIISIPDQVFMGFYALSAYIIKFFITISIKCNLSLVKCAWSCPASPVLHQSAFYLAPGISDLVGYKKKSCISVWKSFLPDQYSADVPGPDTDPGNRVSCRSFFLYAVPGYLLSCRMVI